MKSKLFKLSIFFIGLFLVQACDNGNADVEIFDSPPAITLVKPVNFTANNFSLRVKFFDGADPSISSSPLTTASFSIVPDAGGNAVASGNLTVDGVFTEINNAITPALAPGKYTLTINASDSNGNQAESETSFTVISSIGIIGDSTPGGWGSDTNMVQDATNPDLFSLTVQLGTGEAKFRANDDWAINWGAATFPSGNGTQNGANIPISQGAGTYRVTLDISTGQYSFVKQ